MSRKLSSAEKILLQFLQKHAEREFHLNELIRETTLLPRSVSLAVNQLQKRGFIEEKRVGNLRLVRLNKLQPTTFTTKEINTKEKDVITWQKILNRKIWIDLQVEVNKGCKEYFGKLLRYTKNKKLYEYNWYNSITESLYVVMDEFMLHGRIIGENLTKSGYGESIIQDCHDCAHSLLNYCKEIDPTALMKSNNDQRASIVFNYQKLYRRLMPHLVLGTSIEYGLIEILKNELKNEDLLKQLTTPVYTTLDELTDSLKIISIVKEKKSFEEIIGLIKKHTYKYAYLSMQSPSDIPLTLNNFIDSILSLFQKIGNKSQRETSAKSQKENITRLETTLSLLKVSTHVKQIVWLLQKYMHLRIYSINTIYQSHYYIRPILIHLANRFRLTSDDIFLLTLDEVTALLKNPDLFRIYLHLINKRKKGWAVLMWKGRVSVLSGPEEVLTAIEQYNIKRKFLGQPVSVKSIIGSPAFHGKVTGFARVIKSLSDLNSFKAGEILVTTMTTPDFTPVMVKARAFVTDEGGVTCHAAIVAREMKIPCIVGTRTATQIITTGQFIEVNAIEGSVTILEDTENISFNDHSMSGYSAYPGVIRGNLKVLQYPNTEYFRESGYVLVMKSAEPAFLPHVYKAIALILEEESFTSHGNFYANALKIPTILGVKGATILLNDNMEVLVDATKGQIRILKS